jgi:hypothetical protein
VSLILRERYVLLRDVLTSAVDDDGRARFPDDTLLPTGTEFLVVRDKHPWPNPQSHTLYYLIEPRVSGTDLRLGARYAVPSAYIENAVRAAAA